ncbi:PQQ-binding-like beta-propeller repeat protein [Streptomyces sp. NBC_00083]|uniref:serine/threonine-protein kinase n=1 Tax=Streptomyces sp. NBC_00083 TaxID=2975647 RepID=UPI0022509757|nr:serine/threonine-protein kinase [Streptomyces sp. NBC_00083]MCX5388008.1 PQQ-binding-like beta-propeller repeat protein [Streptomyces sp. NBC_00083]
MASPRSIGFGAPGSEDPESVGAYRLESVLGSGGMGVVHLATSPSGMRLAVKIVHAQHAADPEFRARFRQEVSAARRVSGAFTASVVDADPAADRPWMATVHIPGPTLAERVKDSGPLSATDVRRLGAGLAEALRDIHRAGVVHRDLKPSNVLLAADGPRVIDFGISRPYDSDLRTETGKLIGTPPFMAPEQFQRPREVGPAADVFAMGAVLVHAATGRGPFDSESPYIVAYQVVHNEPDLAGVPDDLVPVLRGCLSKDPGERPTPDELMTALRSAAYGPEASIPTQQFRNPVRGDRAGATGAAGSGPAAGSVETHRSDRPRFDDARPGDPPGRTPAARRARWALAALVLAGVLGGAVVAVQAMPDGTGAVAASEESDATGTPAGPQFRPWQTRLTPGGKDGGEDRTAFCSAGSGDGALYCSAPGVAIARLDAVSGKVMWSVPGAGGQSLSDDYAPAAAGGRVLARAPGGPLRAYDPASGGQVWSADVSAYSGVRPAGAAVLLTTADGHVTALDSATGKELWRKPLGGARAQWVVAGDGAAAYVVTPGTDGGSTSVAAVDPVTGSVRWQARTDGRLRPVAARANAVFLLATDPSGFTSAVVRVDTTTHTARRTRLAAPLDQAQAGVDGDTVYLFGAGGTLVAADTARGNEAWRLDTGLARASRPVASGGQLYLTGADGRLLVFDARKGALAGQTNPRMNAGRYTFTPALPAPLAIGGRVYASAPDGSVFGVDPGDVGNW